jgi:hypothetical protein
LVANLFGIIADPGYDGLSLWGFLVANLFGIIAD